LPEPGEGENRLPLPQRGDAEQPHPLPQRGDAEKRLPLPARGEGGGEGSRARLAASLSQGASPQATGSNPFSTAPLDSPDWTADDSLSRPGASRPALRVLTFVAALTPLLLAGGAFVGQLGVRNAVLAT